MTGGAFSHHREVRGMITEKFKDILYGVQRHHKRRGNPHNPFCTFGSRILVPQVHTPLFDKWLYSSDF